MSRACAYYDYATDEILLLAYDADHDGWVTDRRAMERWAAGHCCVYRRMDRPNTITLAPDFTEWAVLPHALIPRVLETMPHPWIHIRETQIVSSESAMRAHFVTVQAVLDTNDHSEPRLQSLAAVAARALLDLPRPPPLRIPTPTIKLPGWETPGPRPLPRHVAALVIREACAGGALCPITMEPLVAAAAAVTSCGHVFEADAIACWLADNDTCPECRSVCAI